MKTMMMTTTHADVSPYQLKFIYKKIKNIYNQIDEKQKEVEVQLLTVVVNLLNKH